MPNVDPLEAFVVETTDTFDDETTSSYVCTCHWATTSRKMFRQHLIDGQATGCSPRDIHLHVTDGIGTDGVLK